MGINMFNQNDDTSTVGSRSRYGYYYSTSSPSSSVENQRYNEQTSLFGDPVLPASRHTDLLEGGDLYQNLKNNIELYHSKLYNEQEKARQAERDRMFNQFTGGNQQRTTSSATSSSVRNSLGSNMTSLVDDPARRFPRTQSASTGVEFAANRPSLLDMDLLKQNDWINYSEYEYQNSLIPKNSQAVADVQQFTNNNLNRTIENGVFQNPRIAALRSRRNSMSDNLYAASTFSGFESVINVKPSTFTILGHGTGYNSATTSTQVDNSNSSENMSEYERMLRYHRAGATTPIIKDKITTGSNFRVSEARQHKKPAFTIINDVLPKSHSFDASLSPLQLYQNKQRLAANRILSASSMGNSGFYNRILDLVSDGGFPAYQRRFSYSEASQTSPVRRKKSISKKGGKESKRTKTKTTASVVNPGRKQKGVLGVVNKAHLSPNSSTELHDKSAKLIVTAASEDGRSITPDSELPDRVDIPEHVMRNMKLLSYKPFGGRRMLSPVPDKSSMENSQTELQEQSPAKQQSPKKEKSHSYFRKPVFNIRGLLSPRKAKEQEGSPTKTDKGSGGLGAIAAAGAVALAAAAAGDKEKKEEPPKRKRFNLARAIIDFGKKSDLEEKPMEQQPQSRKTEPVVKRDGNRKDSEGNRVKDLKKKEKTKGKISARKDAEDLHERQKPRKGAVNVSTKGVSSKKSSDKALKSDRVISGKHREKSARDISSRTGTRASSGKASAKVLRGGEKSAKAGAKTPQKPVPSPKARPLRRSSSASALKVDSVKKLNRLYEKNTKASERTGKLLKGDKKTRQSTDSLFKKADSKGDLLAGNKPVSAKEIQKRDSEKSLKKSDSNKSLGKLSKKSDSKSSLLGKRSDSKSSLHQTDMKGGMIDASRPGSSIGGAVGSGTDSGTPLNTMKESTPVKPVRMTPKKILQSKGSLLSLLSMRSGSSRNIVDPEKGTADGTKSGSRPGTGTAIGRLKSASVRNINEKPGTPKGSDHDRSSIREKPGSTKPTRRALSKNNSLISMKSIALARSFTSIHRPASRENVDSAKNDSMSQMTKVQEGSQEHDDGDDMKGKGKAMTTSSVTHEMNVAGFGEGQKVANEFSGNSHPSGMGEGDAMNSQASANTDPMNRQHGKDNSDEFNETGKSKCCACCAPCWTKTCLPFKRCFGCSSCCGKGKAADQNKQQPKPKPEDAKRKTSCWQGLKCCRSCRRSKTSPAEAQPAATPKKSCWQSLSCCASCRRNKSRELVPRSSIDSEPEEKTSRCRSCWNKLLCCKRFRKGHDQLERHKMQPEPAEMETVKCCFCFKRTRPKLQPKPKPKKVPVKSSFNCMSCCIMCCPKKGDNNSRRTSTFSKKQSIAPTIPPEDLRPKIDMTLVEHSSMMRGAIPVLPICLAYFCLVLNVLIPGAGTILSGGLCLCIGKPRFSQYDSIKGRIGSFIINCIVGVSQCFTIIFCVVGWGWAIWWGTIMIRLAKQHQKILEMEANQEEGEEQTTLSQRTGASNPPVAMVSQSNRRDVETGR
ncbi:protein stum [Topomyia yanbarensis]|uniref:protein stum n=1 Tax=Topomyia yanbarensis TaxID=2498891 RepID=UPI00273B4F36|nr:protein stum [Topomyia yanbarensis]XP_058835925.1 protein stum [Topomyia yanbarensis]XP_058835926.1 protein stum [Topomyia yanbarensis]